MEGLSIHRGLNNAPGRRDNLVIPGLFYSQGGGWSASHLSVDIADRSLFNVIDIELDCSAVGQVCRIDHPDNIGA